MNDMRISSEIKKILHNIHQSMSFICLSDCCCLSVCLSVHFNGAKDTCSLDKQILLLLITTGHSSASQLCSLPVPCWYKAGAAAGKKAGAAMLLVKKLVLAAIAAVVLAMQVKHEDCRVVDKVQLQLHKSTNRGLTSLIA